MMIKPLKIFYFSLIISRSAGFLLSHQRTVIRPVGRTLSSINLFKAKQDAENNDDFIIDDEFSFFDPTDADLVEKDLERLRHELQKKRVVLETAELALRKAEDIFYQRTHNDTAHLSSSDYGYAVQEARGAFAPGTAVPRSAIRLATANFIRESGNILTGGRATPQNCSAQVLENRAKIKQLRLSNEAIWAREDKRPPIRAPLLIKAPYLFLCVLLDKLFEGDPISRFYFLETVARMPYFSYITMLHTYETLGWWRRSAEAKRVHFAEELNEYNHLLIMESLGGDRKWRVRFFAQHASIAYYFALIAMWIASPTLAYNFRLDVCNPSVSQTLNDFIVCLQ